MEFPNSEPDLANGIIAAGPAGSGVEVESVGDRLFELLEQWHDRYLRQEDPTPEELGVEDPTLREALRERIHHHKRLYDLLKVPILSTEEETGDFGMASPIEEPSVVEAGTVRRAETERRIGRYLVVETLGRGGQGEVFRVVHPELGKELVLKLARRSMAADPASRDQLLREGRLLSGFEHPNLVRVLDLDVHEGRPFVVMEHVQGLNLEQYAGLRRPGPRESARLVAELAQAVAYIHQQGINHQDIKPKNVLIDKMGRPRLIDFGLARYRHAWAEDASGSTGGTTSYMSPEQARSTEAQIGPWTDVFGLGGVLFYLLTGRPVYQGTSAFEVLEQAVRAEQVSPRLVNPKVPRRLERICRKSLAADADQRYRKAEDLEQALRRFLRRPSIVASGAAALSISALVFTLALRRPDRSEPTADPSALTPGIIATATPAVGPRIVSFEVKHFRGNKPPRSLGTIGLSPEPIRFNDDVKVHARLDVPAYCYLIALNPDGKLQLCHPVEATETPSRTDEIAYPLGSYYFPLTDGTGLQAFVLVASREPLPPFSDWEARDGMRWAAVQANDAGIWSFDGRTIEPLGDDPRGQPRPRSGEPLPFKKVCQYLAARPGVDAVKAVVFPVGPKE